MPKNKQKKATSKTHPATTTGAMCTGLREAARIDQIIAAKRRANK